MPVSLVCATCEQVFERPLESYRRKNKRNYCSRTCFFTQVAVKKELLCSGCGDMFWPPNTGAVYSKRNYCPACRTAVDITCPVCSKVFIRRGCRVRKRKTLCCSIPCKAILQRKDWNALSRGMLRQRWEKEFGKSSMICRRCGHDKVFNIVMHHKKYVKDGGGHEPENLEPLCLNCHGVEHYEYGEDKGE